MQVAVFGTLRDQLGVKRMEVPVEAPTALVLVLRELVRRHPSLAEILWTREEKLTGQVKVMINGRALEHLGGPWLSIVLQPDDNVALFYRWASDTSWSQWR
jgi:hypothetical protein